MAKRGDHFRLTIVADRLARFFERFNTHSKCLIVEILSSHDSRVTVVWQLDRFDIGMF